MRNDWETPPTVEGLIVRAWIGEDGQPDVLHVQGVDVADDIGNLDRVIGDPDNPDPNRPFVLVGVVHDRGCQLFFCSGKLWFED